MAQVHDIAATRDRQRANRLSTTVAALTWEECRVGGVIAAWTTMITAFILVYLRWWFGDRVLTDSPEFVAPIIVGTPFLIAIFLILNPDNSGDLVGGFSGRILRLPISTRVCVAVALIARTVFVGVSSALILGLAQALFEDSFRLNMVGFIAFCYLLTQLVDWLRAPTSGLSSVLIALCFGAAIMLMRAGWTHVWSVIQSISIDPTILLVAAASVYVIAVPAVHGARIGRRVGIPEIWQWPGRFSFFWPTRRRPFTSPMTAQIWYEFRRSGLTLWIAMFGFWAASFTVFVFVLSRDLHPDPGAPDMDRLFRSVLPFTSLFFATAIYLMRAPTVRMRTASGGTDYSLLLPLTSAQLASAYIVAFAMAFLPALAIATVAHFYGTPIVSMLANALETGATSPREATWILISRGLLVGLIAWPFFAAKTMLFARITVAMLVSTLLALASYFWITARQEMVWDIASLLFTLFLIAVTTISYAHSWRKGLIPTRAAVRWTIAWALTAWLLTHVLWEAGTMTTMVSAVAACIVSVGCAALVPLPYIAIVQEISRQRHGASYPQDVAQHELPLQTGRTGGTRAVARIGLACAFLFAFWLGWPARPSYEALWRNKGYPTNLVELNAWYEAVPDESNAALDYIAIAEDHGAVLSTYENRKRQRTRGDRSAYYDNLLIVGSADVERAAPIPAAVWAETETYWDGVTSIVAPRLKAFADAGPRPSRYPIDLKEGYQTRLPYLAEVRGLARELHVDALHWAVAGDSTNATDAVVAILPIADSLSNEPILISQLVRIALEGISIYTLEDVMNRVSFADADLIRLQEAFQAAAHASAGQSRMDRAYIGESVIYFDRTADAGTDFLNVPELQVLPERTLPIPRPPFVQLILPAPAERMVAAQHFSEILDQSRYSNIGSLRSEWYGDVALLDNDILFIAPMASMLLPSLARSRDAEWRTMTHHDLAQTAIAVARYRLANGRLPDDLEALVPAFLPEVPRDFYSSEGDNIRYRQRDNHEYVVYSIGRDGEDDFGEEMDNWNQEGDITFTVAPIAGDS